MANRNEFSNKELLRIYSIMIKARLSDEKMLNLLKQSKGFFHMGCAGHEASQLAASKFLKPGKDWIYPYYRDGALCLALGMSVKENFLSFLARGSDPNSGGRQMPMHYGHKKLRIVSQSSATGTQFLQAVGCALSLKTQSITKEIVYVSAGEGTTSQGEFHEAINWASRAKAPIIFHIQDNEYAISTHRSDQTAGSIYEMVNGYKNLDRYNVDGTDFFDTYEAFKLASKRAREGKGPSVIVSNVVRLLPHSSSDDQRKYRSPKDLISDQKKDPILLFEEKCISEDWLDKNKLDLIKDECKNIIEESSVWAEAQDHPLPETAMDYIYSDFLPKEESKFIPISNKTVLVDSINHALHEEMAFNDKMVIYGQDIADPKGGVFTATKGLSTAFGLDRVFNSPLSESSIIGTAVGMAVSGLKPVVEIQFGDYIWTAMMQIRNEVATMRYRSNNDWSCPIVMRVPVGGYIHGGLCHSQSIDGYFIHMPGIYIAYPSNARDAKGLLKMACRMKDPVIFMEHKGLYRQGYASTEEPDSNYLLPFGKANIVKPGNELTIIAWGAMIQKSIEAIQRIEVEKETVELIDLRTLNPLDLETVGESVKKTGKVLVVYEDNLTNGPGSEIAALISDKFFKYLDGPIKRVAAKDSPVPYNWHLEEQILPQVSDIADKLIELLEY